VAGHSALFERTIMGSFILREGGRPRRQIVVGTPLGNLRVYRRKLKPHRIGSTQLTSVDFFRIFISGRAEKLRGDSAPMAQLVEQLTLNQWVPGSSPGGCTLENPFRVKGFGVFGC
jgi:hypothetical protein